MDVNNYPKEVETPSTPPKHGMEQIEAIRKQIEYYFSPENLQNDLYLASQMDANKSVPISLIMRVSRSANVLVSINSSTMLSSSRN
jgi:hypothetical protein